VRAGVDPGSCDQGRHAADILGAKLENKMVGQIYFRGEDILLEGQILPHKF